MKDGEVIKYLEESASSSGFADSDGSWAKFGLAKLEDYMSNIIAGWVENASESTLRSWLQTDLFQSVLEATQFVENHLPAGLDTKFVRAWEDFHALVRAMESHGRTATDVVSPLFVLFWCTVTLRISFEAMLGERSLDLVEIRIEDSRMDRQLLEMVKLKAGQVLFEISSHRTAFSELSSFPETLRRTREMLLAQGN